MTIEIRRIHNDELDLAEALTRIAAQVFEEGEGSDQARMAALLGDSRFWLFGGFDRGRPVAMLSAHVLPMTRCRGSELMIYDLAVLPSHQRQGIGRRLLMATLQSARAAGMIATFVMTDNEDQDAIDFYRAQSGTAQAVTVFNFD